MLYNSCAEEVGNSIKIRLVHQNRIWVCKHICIYICIYIQYTPFINTYLHTHMYNTQSSKIPKMKSCSTTRVLKRSVIRRLRSALYIKIGFGFVNIYAYIYMYEVQEIIEVDLETRLSLVSVDLLLLTLKLKNRKLKNWKLWLLSCHSQSYMQGFM